MPPALSGQCYGSMLGVCVCKSVSVCVCVCVCARRERRGREGGVTAMSCFHASIYMQKLNGIHSAAIMVDLIQQRPTHTHTPKVKSGSISKSERLCCVVGHKSREKGGLLERQEAKKGRKKEHRLNVLHPPPPPPPPPPPHPHHRLPALNDKTC